MEATFLLRRLLFAITVFIQLKTYSDAIDTLSLGASLTGNQTIISTNGTFELGFFSPNETNHWYIGIWYAQISETTIVWVANRETPIRNMPGFLNLSREGHLTLFDAADGVSVWSANATKKASRAVILDSGNFLMLGSDDDTSEPVWQSFEHPVDTWLPEMKLGGQQKLVGWKNSLDPAPGPFSFQVDPSGARQFVLSWKNSVQYSKTGVWDGKSFPQIPELSQIDKSVFNLSVMNSSSGLYMSYRVPPTIRTPSRFVVDKAGALRHYSWIEGGIKWNMIWAQPRDECTVYDLCGAYGICNPNNIQFCGCPEGFKPRDNRAWNLQEWWSSGCVRHTPLNCDPKNGSTDGFKGFNVSLLENLQAGYSYGTVQTQKDCKEMCLRNCSCTAFSYEPPSGPCLIWYGDLFNMRNSPLKSNSEVLIRVAHSELDLRPRSSSTKPKSTAIVGGVAALAIALIGIIVFLMWRRRRQFRSTQMSVDSSDGLLRTFSYKELKIATMNFRHKLGSGGFGSVFKGTLPDKTLVAVKNLESSTKWNEKQFLAEISSVGNIQHVNLVRLRGFCAEASRRLLVYDYMPNGSLNSFLFSPNNTKSGEKVVLDWKTRFEIALGTARGLDYLHEKCRDRIIHGDVKPENILLDANFSPRLADFGLAKLVGRDMSHVLTTTRGTRGYLAPEWISGLPITPKVDVYSFGMTLFEIISGRRNVDPTAHDSSMHYFPPWAATEISRGKMMNIVDKQIANNAVEEEVRRASVVSLLCIQNDENVRPSMAEVVLILEGKMEAHTPSASPQCLNAALMQANTGSSDIDIDGILASGWSSFS